MAMSLPTVPSEFQLFQKAQSLGIVQKEATNLVGQSSHPRVSTSTKVEDSVSPIASKPPSDKIVRNYKLKLPIIQHPFRDRPAIISRSLRPELSGIGTISLNTSVMPKVYSSPDYSDGQYDAEPPRNYMSHTISCERSHSKTVELLRLPTMRSKTNMEYLFKKKKKKEQDKKRNKHVNHLDITNSAPEFILPKEITTRNRGIVEQPEGNKKQNNDEVNTPYKPEGSAITTTQKRPKFNFLHGPVDFYTGKYPLIILDREMRKKQRAVFKTLGMKSNFSREWQVGSDELTRSKTELLPVESSVEHCKERYKTVNNVSDWIGGLQCKQKKLHNRKFLPPNTS
ncbi:uncharacterized protein LOC144359414 [Saccoglossus kowalevskii]